jgi:hypothetical protein
MKLVSSKSFGLHIRILHLVKTCKLSIDHVGNLTSELKRFFGYMTHHIMLEQVHPIEVYVSNYIQSSLEKHYNMFQ